MERALKVEACQYDFTCIIFSILGVVKAGGFYLGSQNHYLVRSDNMKKVLLSICTVEFVYWTYLNCIILRDILFVIKMLMECDFFIEDYQEGSEESYE